MTQTKPRTWSVQLQFDEYGNALWGEFRDAAQAAMLEVEAIGDRIGGYFYAVPGRAQLGDEWVTVKWDFRWTSFVPAPQAAAPEPEPAPEDEEMTADAEPEAAAVAA